MNILEELRELTLNNLTDLFNTDWSAVQYKRASFASWAAIALFAALLLKLSWPFLNRVLFQRTVPVKSAFEHSGYSFGKQHKKTFWHKVCILLIVVFLVLGLGTFLVTTADPYLLQHHQKHSIKSREISYLEDCSVSSGFRFAGQRKSRAEIMREFILQLIADRREQNDRAAFIIYATYPYRITDFTTDSKSLMFSVYNAPLVIADPMTPKIEIYKGLFVVKDFMKVDFGGESDLFLGLKAMIELFDERGDPKITEEIKQNPTIKRRSVVIATDGASSRDPEPMFKELAKRGIVPYLIYIDPDKAAERKINGDDSPEVKLPSQLLRQVKRYGGDYFIASNRSSLNEIRKKLDLIHAATIDVKVYSTEQHIYRQPLVASLVLFGLALLLRLALWRFHKIV